MFTSRHQFTCPDVVHLRNQQKKVQIATLGVYGTIFGGFALMGVIADKKAKRRLTKTIDETPTE